MSIKIHWGPPGSYKTSGAVADDLLPAARAGRVVVTNVRGLTLEAVLAVYPDMPLSFDVINIDSSTTDGLLKIATWFHWVPNGAFMLWDESPKVFPRKWRQKSIDELDFPGGVDVAKAAGRPENWEVAWTMHRHYNWDIVLTAPDIRHIRSDIRECAEGAYKHKNRALVGLKGSYMEALHSAGTGGRAYDFIGTPRTKKIPKEVFQIYGSTQTGEISDTLAGISIFSDPKIVGMLVFLALVFVFIYWRSGDANLRVLGFEETSSPPSPPPAVSAPLNPAPVPASPSRVTPPNSVPLGSAAVVHPLSEFDIFIDGHSDFRGQRVYYFALFPRLSRASSSASASESYILHSQRDLKRLGYSFKSLGSCSLQLIYGDSFTQWVFCRPPVDSVPDPSSRLAQSASLP